MTIREFVSVVKNNLSSIYLDDYISSEYIFNVGISIGNLFLKRETDSRKIYKNSSLFKKIDCVEMIQTNVNECGIYIPCNTISRSKKELPKPFLTNFGTLLKVFNLNRSIEYVEVSPTLYSLKKDRKYNKKNYFWIENNYLYLPDSEVELVTITGLFSDTEALNNNISTTDCNKLLDSDFPIPDYLIAAVIENTTNQILTSKKINKDEDSNLNTLDKQ